MRSVIIQAALLCVLTTHAHAGDSSLQKMQRTPGLQRVMAEAAGRVVNMTCADVRAVVAIYGERRAETVARASGASNAQINQAKRCLK